MYTVEISPPAWNQLAHLSLETYRRIREELDAVATALGEGLHPVRSGSVKVAGRPASAPSVVVDDAVVVYDVDHERQRILLVEVARRLPREL